MAGRFKKAPLIYATARITTNQLPEFSHDQTASVQQELLKLGFEFYKSEGSVLSVSANTDNHKINSTTTSFQRLGYFNSDKTVCLIIDRNNIEWRTTKYATYNEFIDQLNEVIKTLINTVDAIGYSVAKEFTLSYVDIIAPTNKRNLSDYFKEPNNILPLYLVEQEQNDLHQAGVVQVTRVVNPTQRIIINLEQLPKVDGKVQKYMPDMLSEPDTTFGMPIKVRENWEDATSKDNNYALLSTQAGVLKKVELKEFDSRKVFKEAHILTRETFSGLLNRSVCDKDWEFESAEKV